MAASKAGGTARSSIDPEELERFSAWADEWWDPHGKFRPLHNFNPARLRFIRDRLAAHFGRDPLAERPLAGVRLLDIGCGGGLVCEPMARLGAVVVGVDAVDRNIEAARVHAEKIGLAIDYRLGTAEALVEADERFDAILNLEVVEHVADVDLFLGACAALLNPGAPMIVATLNRTLKSLLLAKIGAEYVLRWLPPGTHDWNRFLRPSELAAALRPHGVEIAGLSGVSYNPITDAWALSGNLAVNYMVYAVKSETNQAS
jgi:2-polyprenyl-6-hydroxyphenyl methylase/3-demethylubiquinone-9 3-methyltransferase